MRAEAIYKGATRPAMKLGVPLKPLVALVGSGMLLTMWAGVLVSWWIGLSVAAAVVPALLWMRLITVRDDQRLAQFVLLLQLRLRDRNSSFWRARSYTPVIFKGARDAWHA